MPKMYFHLSAEERGLIMAERLRGSSNAAIARMLCRSPSTLSRELRRSGDGDQYNATASGAAYRDRRRSCGRRCKLQDGTAMHAFVRNHLLYRYWSPQQIAAIYAHPKGALREGMIAALRQAKSSRGRPRRTAAKRGGLNISSDIDIKNRPEEIAQRLLPRHWEGDFIKGAYNRSAVGTLFERKTR